VCDTWSPEQTTIESRSTTNMSTVRHPACNLSRKADATLKFNYFHCSRIRQYIHDGIESMLRKNAFLGIFPATVKNARIKMLLSMDNEPCLSL
jgi:hypothetical protein